MNARLKEPEAITYWAQVEEQENNNSIQIIAEIKSKDDRKSIINVNSNLELNPGETLLLIKKKDTIISNIPAFKVYNSDRELMGYKPVSSGRGWIMMLKKQIYFLAVSVITIFLSLIGFVVFLITKSTVIYPTIYLVAFVFGLGWLFTAIRGLSDVIKRGKNGV